MKIYTRTGDDGTTGLLFGGRLPKDSTVIAANGAVDEAQASLGVVRARVEKGSELDDLLVRLEKDLYVLMAEVATASISSPLRPLAEQKWAKTSMVACARAIPRSPSSPVAARPSPMRTAS